MNGAINIALILMLALGMAIFFRVSIATGYARGMVCIVVWIFAFIGFLTVLHRCL